VVSNNSYILSIMIALRHVKSQLGCNMQKQAYMFRKFFSIPNQSERVYCRYDTKDKS